VDWRTRNLFALAVVVVIVVTGGAAVLFSSGGTAQPASRQSVDGVIVAVDSAGLDEVRGFSLRTDDGQSIDFTIGSLENGVEFPPGHLAEHQATAQRVRVWYVRDGEASVAVRLEDAP
jgi:hypothetical protein